MNKKEHQIENIKVVRYKQRNAKPKIALHLPGGYSGEMLEGFIERNEKELKKLR